MKRLITYALLSIPFLFAACSKEEEAAAPQSGFTALVDGVKWKASVSKASVYNGAIFISGISSDGKEISINIYGDSAGLYALNENTVNSASVSTGGAELFTSGGSPTAGGTVLIESISFSKHLITGSFEYKAVRPSDDSTIQVTAGRFVDLKFSEQPVTNEDNSLRVKINDNLWAPQEVTGFTAFTTLFLQARDGSGSRILRFELPGEIAPGNYVLNYFTNYKAVFTDVAGNTYYAVDGLLEIESHNLAEKKITGSFDMNAEAHEDGGTADFTEGTFTINYD